MNDYLALGVCIAIVSFYAGYKYGLKEIPYLVKQIMKKNQRLENKCYDLIDENVKLHNKIKELQNEN